LPVFVVAGVPLALMVPAPLEVSVSAEFRMKM
jgi:hypothetical protein